MPSLANFFLWGKIKNVIHPSEEAILATKGVPVIFMETPGYLKTKVWEPLLKIITKNLGRPQGVEQEGALALTWILENSVCGRPCQKLKWN